jgi:hypothetical protein
MVYRIIIMCEDENGDWQREMRDGDEGIKARCSVKMGGGIGAGRL